MNKGCIQVNLKGGIGNQLFIWAAGKSLCMQNEWDLIVNVDNLSGSHYCLTQLGIELTETKKYSLQRMKKLLKSTKIPLNTFVENPAKGGGFDTRISQVVSGNILEGYFQSTRYFNSHIREIRDEILFNSELDANSELIIKEFGVESCIAVHIRGSDYLNFKDYFTQLTIKYFSEAIDILQLKLGQFPIIVFTDDLDFAKSLVPNADKYITKTDIGCPVQNLLVMSQAAGFIGSNSTYSWWAAFLLNNQNNIVFPSPWFKLERDEKNDLYMPMWRTIKI
jgi:hypothetical protein